MIASISPEPSPIFPEVPTTADEGFDTELVPQIRGIMAPPDMPEDALVYYHDVFKDLVKTQSWKDYAVKSCALPNIMSASPFNSAAMR